MSAISCKNISKSYLITHNSGDYLTLRDALVKNLKNPMRLIIGRSKRHETIWALKNVNFEIASGEAVGIIGANGAGKSTLLKILSRITSPTEGGISITGKIASLLEVGTGFHPELSGRENVFLNGSILGMKKKDILKKFDEIIEFSGVEKFVDTPVKFYSTGMAVRLAFSVAAHLDSDILFVDEVLSVGDAEFQKKSFDKMNQIIRNQGKTVVLVSHNISAVKQFCTRVLYLDKGFVKFDGPPDMAGDMYLTNRSDMLVPIFSAEKSPLSLTNFKMNNIDNKESVLFAHNEDIIFDIIFDSNIAKDIVFSLSIRDEENNLLINMINTDYDIPYKIKKGQNRLLLTYKRNQLRPSNYFVSIRIGESLDHEPFLYIKHVGKFSIYNTKKINIKTASHFFADTNWEIRD